MLTRSKKPYDASFYELLFGLFLVNIRSSFVHWIVPHAATSRSMHSRAQSIAVDVFKSRV